jgi:predicted metal-dependent hydrolase
LWFNAAVTVSSRGFSSEGEARVRFWFLVCAHELAHNTVSGHDSRFSDVCSAIVLEYAARYRVFASAFQQQY